MTSSPHESSGGALPTPVQQEEKHVSLPGRLLWWAATLALFVMFWAGIQFLALLIQAERLRAAIESGLESARLPESTEFSVSQETERAIKRVVGKAPWHDRYYVDGNLRPLPFSRTLLFNAGLFKTLRVEVEVASDDLLPWWLGPRLVGLTPEAVAVQEELSLP